MEEVWKDIPEYEGLYQVSNLGNVKSLNRGVLQNGSIRLLKGVILKKNKHRKGYQYIYLCKNGKTKFWLVHRLVAFVFIENTNKKPCVNHIDGNKINNKIENLEWCTHKENTQHALNLKLIDVSKKYSIKESERKKIYNIYIEGLLDQYQLAEIYNVHQSTINRIIKHYENWEENLQEKLKTKP